MPEIDFYLIQNQVGSAGFKLASRLANKLQRLGQRALVVTDSEQDADALDKIMWTFSDTSFVAHERLQPSAPTQSADHSSMAIAIASVDELGGVKSGNSTEFDVLINLATQVPPISAEFARVAEIVGPDEAAKAAARHRYRQYQSDNCTLRTHKMEI